MGLKKEVEETKEFEQASDDNEFDLDLDAPDELFNALE
jgi:hypothetical protein